MASSTPVLVLSVLVLLLVACDDAKSPSHPDADPDFGHDAPLPPIPDDLPCPEALAPVSHQAPIHTVGDGSPASCTEAALRTALSALTLAGSGTLTFACGLDPHTIVLTEALQVRSSKTDPVIVDGEERITLSGQGQTRIFDLDNHTRFVVQRLTLRDGYVAAGEAAVTNRPSDSGAAIRHPWFGTLHAIDVHFINNHCASRAGEIGGGAIYAGGLSEAVISGCTFVENSASNGGAILNRGTNLTVIRTVFAGNGALSTGSGQYGNGGGLYIDGMNYDEPGNFYMCGTAFIGNTAMTHGAGLFSYYYPGSAATIDTCLFDGNRFGNPDDGSGALYHQAAPLLLKNTALINHHTGKHAGGLFLGSGSSAEIVNCTFANNTVTMNGAGIFNGASTAEIVNSTFTGNKADYGPAIFKGKEASMTLKNSLMVHNLTDNAYSATSCHEALIDGGGNLQWPRVKANGRDDVACAAGILFADPLLEEVADNGGFSPTAALASASPARGLGRDCPERDQRGQDRPEPCDAGAFQGE